MKESQHDRTSRLKQDFHQAFGREMTAEEQKMLLLADTVAPILSEDDDLTDSIAVAS